MSQNLATFLYLISAVCFIMSLKGLSSPETSHTGLRYGVGGMIMSKGMGAALSTNLGYGAVYPICDFTYLLAVLVIHVCSPKYDPAKV